MKKIEKMNQMLTLINEIDKKQAQIKERLDKGKENYTKEDIINAMIDDKEVKILLEKCKVLCNE